MKKAEIEEAEGSVTGTENRTIIRPPDAKEHALNIKKIQALINQKEVHFKMLQNKMTPTSKTKTPGKIYCSHDRETLIRELKTLREEREKDCQLRKHLDQELKTLNSQVLCKNDSCSRLNAALRYKSEERIDDAIRRLEHQINIQQLTIREEKRMVSEIDSLRRSKKTLKEYLESKKLLDNLRTRQKTLRANRDACSRKINGGKSKEESIKTALDELEEQPDPSDSQEVKQHPISQKEALKKEIDELYNKKREQIAKFNKEKMEYQATMKDIRAEIVQQRKVESLKKAEERNAERQLQLQEIRQKQRSFHSDVEDQLTICRNLSAHLEKLQNSTSGVPHTPNSLLEENSTQVLVKNDETAGMFLRQKTAPDAEMVGLYAGLGRKGSKRLRKSRRTATAQSSKKLVLHPDVIKQLLALNLNVPGTAAELPQLLEELKEKQMSLENPVSVAAAVNIEKVKKPTDYVDENTNMNSTDVGSITADIAGSSSTCQVPEMNDKPVIPISDGNAPDIKGEFFNKMTDSDELRTLQKVELATELNDSETDGDNDGDSNGDANDGDDDSQIGTVVKNTNCMKKVSLLKVSHNDSVESPDSQNSTEKWKIKSKGSNEDCKLSQKVAAVERAAGERVAVERASVECEAVERAAVERAEIRGLLPSVCNQDEDLPLINDTSLDQKEKRMLNQEESINNFKTDDKYLRQNSSSGYSCSGSSVSKQMNGIELEERSSFSNVLPSAGKDTKSDSRSCKVLLKEKSLSFDDNVTRQSVGTELSRITCEKCPA